MAAAPSRDGHSFFHRPMTRVGDRRRNEACRLRARRCNRFPRPRIQVCRVFREQGMDRRATPATGRDRMGWRWSAAFVPLIVLAHEMHELAHTLSGRLACGRWAQRDFSRWSIHDCPSWLPGAMGPLFSFALMAVGVWLARAPRGARRWWALALIFAANPLARIVTAASGRGDEQLLARNLGGIDGFSLPLYLLTLACVLLLAGGAILAGWFATRGLRVRVATFALLLVAAMLVTGPGSMAFNRLLQAGVLDQPVAGAPLLVHAVTLAALLCLLAGARWLGNPRVATGSPFRAMPSRERQQENRGAPG